MRRLVPFLMLAASLSGCLPAADIGSGEADPSGAVSFAPAGAAAFTLPELSQALAAGEVTSEAVTLAYLQRIEEVDRAGPRLQSVLALNPEALQQARAADARRAAGAALGPLDGVPVLLKDNIESLDPIATTAGSLALAENVTGRDSPVAAGLRAAGAVILGKTNLSEWANFRSSASVSGWSAVAGQVRNPHMLDRSPCGSSSGTGAAIAASLAAGGVGTETNGSIICPSHVNGLVGFKPTVGILSQEGIVPISASQDTAGPMTRTVLGTAMLMNAMDPADTDYVAALSSQALSGVRVGVLRGAIGSNPDVIGLFDAALIQLRDLGAEPVEITAQELPPGFWPASLTVLEYEFRAGLDAYLASTPASVATRSLAELIDFNKRHADRELALFGQELLEASVMRGSLSDPAYVEARNLVQKAAGAEGIDRLMRDHDVDVLLAPSGPLASRIDPVNGDVWPDWAGAGYLAAIAGYPHLTVPMGTVHAIPVGLSFMGGAGQDSQVLAYGYAFEQATRLRPDPQYLPDAEARPEIAAAMQR